MLQTRFCEQAFEPLTEEQSFEVNGGLPQATIDTLTGAVMIAVGVVVAVVGVAVAAKGVKTGNPTAVLTGVGGVALGVNTIQSGNDRLPHPF